MTAAQPGAIPPAGVTVRIADEDDVPRLAALRRAWNEENAGRPIDDPAFDAAFNAWWVAERTRRTHFLAETAAGAVGMANVLRYDRMPVAGRASGGHWGYVGNVYVLPDHRRAGIGRTIMEAVVEWAWRHGMEHLRLAPSPISGTLYARLGFVPGTVVELDPPRE